MSVAFEDAAYAGMAAAPVPPPISAAAGGAAAPAVARLSSDVIVAEGADGRFKIGVGSDRFLFSVTLSSTANLAALVSPETRLSEAFFFYYTLFGRDYTTPPFRDVLVPDCAPHTGDAHVASSGMELAYFFQHQPALAIHLCKCVLGRVARRLRPSHACTPCNRFLFVQR